MAIQKVRLGGLYTREDMLASAEFVLPPELLPPDHRTELVTITSMDISPPQGLSAWRYQYLTQQTCKQEFHSIYISAVRAVGIK